MRFIFLFFLLITTLSGFSQQILRGSVEGKEGPVPGATIRQLPDGGMTVTDSLGKFRLEIADQNIIRIEIRSLGYKSVLKEILPASDEKIKILLEESSLGLDEVVITGTLQPVFVSQSAIKTEVLTTKHFNTFMPSASNNLVDAMSMVNGVQEVVSCGVCFTNSLSINGLPGQYTSILIDGTPMYGNLASVYGLNGIPGIMVDRVEVVKGPGSTLYGSEALAGVINIITRDPAKQPILTADVMGTTHGEMFFNTAVSGKLKKISTYSGLSYSGMHQYIDENRDGFGDIINMDRIAIFSKWEAQLPKDQKLSVSAKFMTEDRRNGVQSFLENHNSLRGNDTIYGESIQTERFELFGSFTGNHGYKIDYSFSIHDQNSFYGSDLYEAKQQIGFINAYRRLESGRHAILAGVTSRYQYYDDNTVATPGGADKQFIPGIFIQDELALSPSLTFLGGLRTDYYEKHGLIFSPRFNAKWKAGDWTTLRVNSGTGFRLVNLFTEDHAFVTGQRSIEIREELKPERSANISLNLNHILTMGSSQASVDFDVFYTHFTNKIIPDYSDPGKIIYDNTAGHAQTGGVSFSWTQEFIFPLQVMAAGTLLRSTETGEEGIKENLPFAPEWSALLNISYTIPRSNWIFAWSATFTGSMLLPEVFDLDEQGQPMADPRPRTSSPFQIHNIQITKSWKNLRLYGGVSNIFNFTQPVSPLSGLNDPYSNPGFSNFFDTAYSYAPIHGREFFVGINWSLFK
ncbi:TonB-dependent receptor [Fulvivirga sedimenti]|uniref:TonB-dependent receptor n=1 Tax=Fulvivirga sedimenti TaxID=2879465 RepID=A0A9X1HT32_9BACT|nr:TonB-dependent receptor [Fulvivirga sedimenti]MCA6075509.1 TonB-dependent receptor [Fulvivirga sedimenti]MCA6076686.1 TonB-dependent receptor [Fulvivirga sedimenti]MCA6077814.1 TonB-dependent receptor [Fulvivirga sedimenti]